MTRNPHPTLFRWRKLATELQEITAACESSGRRLDDDARERVGLLMAREALALGASSVIAQSESVVPPATATENLAELETVIERGVKTFVEVGEALSIIRDQRLYKAEYKTFDDYCKERWGWDRTYAHRLIDAADVTARVLPIGNTTPSSESQVRPLTKLPAEDQPAAWQEAVDTAEERGEI